MNRDRRSSSQDPTAERTTDQSTQSASGLSSPPSGPGVERNLALDEEVVNRTEPDSTPRRYEQPLDADRDPVMPADDSALPTKI
jgi:hypothetical protein